MSKRAGRAAIVTGAASGIGRACAVELASDGFVVGLLDIDGPTLESAAAEIVAAGGQALAFAVDVTDEASVRDAVTTVENKLGPLYALVHSAGVLHHRPSLEEDLSDWRRLIDINLTGTFVCDRAAARVMLPRGDGGRIVNIASVHSQSPSAGLAAYDASKGGVWMLTRSLALELAPHAVTVNAVGPGLILQTGLGGGTSEEYLSAVVPAIPLGRPGMPDDIAGPVAFLCSDSARYITGAFLVVDGGMLLTART